jgi:dipeptidyl aminopeptidase/acylaminoacyl peptidase
MPIREEEVAFHNGSVRLGGTLLLPQLPDAQRLCPGVALVHGSGDDPRDDYRIFAEYFAARGIATLIYDKRGVGASTGNWRSGTFAELAGDALAAVHLLAARPEIDPQRVGLWGCSEGGWVAPLAAARSTEVRFLVAISAPGMSPAQQEHYRRRLIIEASSASQITRSRRMATVHLMFGLLRHTPKRMWPGMVGYFSRTMDFDPLPTWKQVTQPVLLIFGAADASVPPQESADLIAHALHTAGHHDCTIRIFPGGDHGIRYRDETTQKLTFVPGYLDSLVAWILAR